MVDQVNSSALGSAYSLVLPKQTTQTGIQGSLFGMIFSENSSQFASKDTANVLASFLGAKVVDESSQWAGGTPGPLYGIQFNNGKLLNAGLLADRFTRYGVDSALQMTEAEVGGAIQIVPQAPTSPASGYGPSATAASVTSPTQANSSASGSANLLVLSKQATQTGIQGSTFGTIFSENSSQFATKETADALASFLGAKVVDESPQWAGGSAGSMYGIQFNNGKLLNAGLLADRFTRYGIDSSLQMTEAEIGGSIQIAPLASNTPASAYGPSAPGASLAPSTSSDASTNSAPAYSAVASAPKLSTPAAALSPALPAAVDPTTALVASTAPAIKAEDSQADTTKLAQAAKQFESLLIGQLLKSSTEGHEDGLLGGGGSTESASLMEMAQEQFAQAISAQGGFGLSDMIIHQVGQNSAKASIRS